MAWVGVARLLARRQVWQVWWLCLWLLWPKGSHLHTHYVQFTSGAWLLVMAGQEPVIMTRTRMPLTHALRRVLQPSTTPLHHVFATTFVSPHVGPEATRLLPSSTDRHVNPTTTPYTVLTQHFLLDARQCTRPELVRRPQTRHIMGWQLHLIRQPKPEPSLLTATRWCFPLDGHALCR